jgi:glc operon protein GlcG
MSRWLLSAGCACCLLYSFASVSSAQTAAAASSPIPYGMSLSLADAKRALQAAEQEANREGWPVAIAVVDPAGYLVAFSKLDNTQLGSIEVAMQKAKTATLYRRTTKELEDRLIAGGANLKVLSLPGLPIEGGVPIIVQGKIVGAIGVSGVQSTQDAQVAAAGAAALAAPRQP